MLRSRIEFNVSQALLVKRIILGPAIAACFLVPVLVLLIAGFRFVLARRKSRAMPGSIKAGH
jgi:hypothetical protein